MKINETDIKRIDEHNIGDISFSFEGRGFEDADVAILAEHFSKHPYLQHLDLSRNNITTQGARHLLKLTNLITLKLSRNNITDDIIDDMIAMKNLKFLYLDNNALTDKAATSILINGAHQFILNVDGNIITSELRRQVDEKIAANKASQPDSDFKRGFFFPGLGDFSNGIHPLETDRDYDKTNGLG